MVQEDLPFMLLLLLVLHKLVLVVILKGLTASSCEWAVTRGLELVLVVVVVVVVEASPLLLLLVVVVLVGVWWLGVRQGGQQGRLTRGRTTISSSLEEQLSAPGRLVW